MYLSEKISDSLITIIVHCIDTIILVVIIINNGKNNGNTNFMSYSK